jgi:hypothetical protein
VPSLRTSIPVLPQETADFRVWDGLDLASRSDQPIRLARGGVFIFTGGGAAAPKPGIEADVHFLPAPVEAAPPKVFNAKELIVQLEPLIKAERCNLGNICPHVHEYLLPKGTLR